MKICLNCGDSIGSQATKFCDASCRVDYHKSKKLPRNCHYCYKELLPGSGNKKYCSEECKYRTRKNLLETKNGMIRYCKNPKCFSILNREDNGNRQFCSHKCQSRYRTLSRDREKLIRTVNASNIEKKKRENPMVACANVRCCKMTPVENKYCSKSCSKLSEIISSGKQITSRMAEEIMVMRHKERLERVRKFNRDIMFGVPSIQPDKPDKL